jgi:predicted CXXCH cytochrome family protein
MKKSLTVVSLLLLIVLSFNQKTFSGPPSDSATFVGSQTCGSCMTSQYNTWSKTLFPKMIKPIADATLKNDADGNGTIDFEDGFTLNGSHTFDITFGVLSTFPPVLGKNGSIYTITIGSITYNVDFVIGTNWKQLYMTKIEQSYYILPVQYNIASKQYEPFSPENWYEKNGNVYTNPMYSANDTPIIKNRTNDSWQNRCMGCHVTGLTSVTKLETGDWQGEVGNQFLEYGVACEACHGPGSEHAGGAYAQADKKIVNPRTVTDMQIRLSICGRCHVRSKSTGGLHGYPWNDATNDRMQAGDNLDDYCTLDGSRYPDGTSNLNEQQYHDFKLESHFNNTKSPFACNECHSPHSTSGVRHILKYDYSDNTLCLNCHTALNFPDENAITAHTHHAYDPANGLSRCTACHRPLVIKSGVYYDIASHTAEAITPERTLKFGMPNSCMISCHKTETINNVTYTNDNLSDWTQEADTAIATYLDGFAKQWWGGTMPTAQVGTDKESYKKDEQIMIKLGVTNPAARLFNSQLVLLMLTPDNRLEFFPTWTSNFTGIKFTLPYFFQLPLTPVIPAVAGNVTGTYFLGFAILNPDSDLSNLVFYSNFSAESGTISTFSVNP